MNAKPIFRRLVTPVSLAQETLVRRSFLSDSDALPVVWTPTVGAVDLVEWVRLNEKRLREDILQFGGVLFRGFEIGNLDEFHRIAQMLGEAPLTYAANIFPLSEADKKTYRTGATYPPQLRLTWHNESSFDECRWARKFMFYSHTPAAQGGQTPICDGRRMLDAIDPVVRQEFMRRGICYVRNYHAELGNSWRIQFGASTRADVLNYCREWDIDVQWFAGDRLRTSCRRPAVIRHPQTRQLIWFNVLQMWHTYGIDPELLTAWRKVFAPEDYPMNCYFGDGAPIEDAYIAELYRAHAQLEVLFDWKTNDVLVVDNLLVTHGRNPFVGARVHYVAFDKELSLHEIPFEDRIWADAGTNGSSKLT
jgi:Taurine catabolism dioxygenase TauD, TfdA family